VISIREQIITRICELLPQISVSNGYNINVSSEMIYRNIDVTEDIVSDVVTVVIDGEEERQGAYSQDIRTMNLTILILANISDVLQTSKESNKIAADIEKFLGVLDNDTQIKNLVRIIRISGLSIQNMNSRSTIAGASIDFIITFGTKRADPYTLI